MAAILKIHESVNLV